MAKCFRVVGQGIPVRMSDEDAFQVVVRDHDGEYCPKRAWKEGRGTEDDNRIRKLVGSNIVETATLHFNAQHARRGRERQTR